MGIPAPSDDGGGGGGGDAMTSLSTSCPHCFSAGTTKLSETAFPDPLGELLVEAFECEECGYR